MTDDLQIIEILLNSRYVILLHKPIAEADRERMRKRLQDWQQSNEQFFILQGDITLQRVEEEIK